MVKDRAQSASMAAAPDSLLRRVVGFDQQISRALYYRTWASEGAQPIIRYSTKFLEYSGHGVPWFILVAFLLSIEIFPELPSWVPANLFVALIGDLLAAATIKAIVRRSRPNYNESGRHHVLDVLAGAIIGFAVAQVIAAFFWGQALRAVPARKREDAKTLRATRRHQATRVGPLAAYYQRVEEQHLRLDHAQVVAGQHLQRLHDELSRYTPPLLGDYDAHVRLECKRARQRQQRQLLEDHERQMDELYGFAGAEKARHMSSEAAMLPSLKEPPQGVYLWGPVGCGKSMLMDLFFAGAPVQDDRKLRIHFHSFMRDVLAHLHRLSLNCTSTQRATYNDNLIQLIAKGIAQQAYVLCFDEMQVPDVATAGILYRLFQHLQDYGVVVVATSNRPPAELYNGHFREALFEPFVRILEERTEVLKVEGEADYRVLMRGGASAVEGTRAAFLDPYCFGQHARRDLWETWELATEGQAHAHDSGMQQISVATVPVLGRDVVIPRASDDRQAYFTFQELCAAPLGPADYLAIARQFQAVFLEGVPRLSMSTRNEARRLISLVDALYECKTKLYASFDIALERLFVDVEDPEGDRFEIMHGEMMAQIFYDLGMDETRRHDASPFQSNLFSGEEEIFASKRCISRLQEMQSPMYGTSDHQAKLGFVELDPGALDYGLEVAASAPSADAVTQPRADRRNKPKFGAKHFWGAGWWESILERRTQKKDS
ncbi:uncharacterized protein MONBRDRAFT_25180 [Monosiga brevicollis MX1]|uniref:AAA+ ATPase domain-containing protein n=1 Tax=Monosiga brevicollis TaxID=81824 RepID=A9UYM8_MONBE|nr:uncharacterized protein MONBRDRAFT_25180 [Monosiga brevicollis MX1]EDQ89491.1 predicted protein [Monosiga brevicollis MX1]|eukprot:XP_001745520.1 hypothetical protein [Monosiga brevicollis MX1]